MYITAFLSAFCFSQEPVLTADPAVQVESTGLENPFDNLPNEVVLQILDHVDDFGDIASCLTVDRRFQRLMLDDLSHYELDLPDSYDLRESYGKSSYNLLSLLSRLTNDYSLPTVIISRYNVEKIRNFSRLWASSFELYDPGDDRDLSQEMREFLCGDNPPNIVKLHISYDKPGFEFWIKYASRTLRELTIDYNQTLFLRRPIRMYLLNQLFSKHFPVLEKLTLSQIELSGSDLLNLARNAAHFPSLVDLDLSSNNLNSQAFNLFAHFGLSRQLRRLDLSRTQISSDKLAYFIKYADLRNLNYLSIADTGTDPEQTLDPQGSIRIQIDNYWKVYWNRRHHNPVQQDIDLRSALQSTRNLGVLKELDLSGTHVFDGRGPEIMEYLSLPSLRILRLTDQTRIKLEDPDSDDEPSSVYSGEGSDSEGEIMS